MARSHICRGEGHLSRTRRPDHRRICAHTLKSIALAASFVSGGLPCKQRGVTNGLSVLRGNDSDTTYASKAQLGCLGDDETGAECRSKHSHQYELETGLEDLSVEPPQAWAYQPGQLSSPCHLLAIRVNISSVSVGVDERNSTTTCMAVSNTARAAPRLLMACLHQSPTGVTCLRAPVTSIPRDHTAVDKDSAGAPPGCVPLQ